MSEFDVGVALGVFAGTVLLVGGFVLYMLYCMHHAERRNNQITDADAIALNVAVDIAKNGERIRTEAEERRDAELAEAEAEVQRDRMAIRIAYHSTQLERALVAHKGQPIDVHAVADHFLYTGQWAIPRQLAHCAAAVVQEERDREQAQTKEQTQDKRRTLYEVL